MVYRPPFIKQLDGSTYGGRNCTVAASCMAAIRHTRGADPAGSAQWRPTPRYIRAKMGDYSGGTNLAQNEAIFYKLYRIDFDVHYRLPWANFVANIKIGRGAVFQGRYSVFHGTRYDASGTFMGNHAVYINEWRYNATKKRNEFLMYDPLADGRRRGIYKGPTWIDEATLKRFAAALQLNPNRDTRLGLGYTFVMFTRDTEPSLVLKYGGVAYTKTLYAKVNGARIRKSPSTAAAISRTLNVNDKFSARQRTTTGQLVNGSRVWYGDATGTQWMHSSVVKLTT
jgi:hypothetical protein